MAAIKTLFFHLSTIKPTSPDAQDIDGTRRVCFSLGSLLADCVVGDLVVGVEGPLKVESIGVPIPI